MFINNNTVVVIALIAENWECGNLTKISLIGEETQ